MNRFTYLLANLLIFPIVLFFFWRRPDLRSKMVILGTIFGLAGIVSEFWFVKDYWQPQYALGQPLVIEDFLFGFLCGSGPTVAYQIFFGKKLGAKKHPRNNNRLIFVAVLGTILIVLFNNILKINSIFASTLASVITTSIMLFLRRDLVKVSLITGLLTGLFAFVFYFLVASATFDYLASAWLLFNQPLGKTILGIPLTEILWATSWGLFAGPFYEFWQGYTIVPFKRS